MAAKQIEKFQPQMVSVQDGKDIEKLKEILKANGYNGPMPELVDGNDGMCAVAAHKDCEAVVTGIVGCAGLPPTVAAINAKKNICLANKETLIAGGPAIVPLAVKNGVKILPAGFRTLRVVSMHARFTAGSVTQNHLNRLWWGVQRRRPRGNATHGRTRAGKVTRESDHAPELGHGLKITCDSATLMNKALEVIEAHYLYGTSYDNIDVVIHPQSIIHSMVETADSSVLAQLGWPDMRLPILYTMSGRNANCSFEQTWPRLDFVKMGDLTFKEPDTKKYPSLTMATPPVDSAEP